VHVFEVTFLGVFQKFVVGYSKAWSYTVFGSWKNSVLSLKSACTLPAITLSNYYLYHEMRHPRHLVPIPKILVFVMASKLTFPKDLKISQSTTEPWRTKPNIALVKPTSI